MKRIFFYSFFLLIILSCNNQSKTDGQIQESTENESLKAQEAISNNNRLIEQWYRSKQIDSVLNYMADNVIQFPPNNKPLVGKDSIRSYWGQLFQFGNIDFSLTTQEVKANGPLAIELGKYSLKFNPEAKSPIPAFVDSGHYLVYWQKINDNWKAVWDAPVSIMPLPSSQK